jgi:hypothetical protein
MKCTHRNPLLGGAGGEVLAVRGAGEVLADQPGYEQQCGPGPVVGHDVLRLPGGVAVTRTMLPSCSPRTRAV